VGDIRLRVLHVGPKNYPPNHGGVEKIVYDLVTGMPEVENHIFTEWEPQIDCPRVMALPKGLFHQLRTVHAYAIKESIDIIHVHKETFIPLGLLLKLFGHRCVVTIHGCAWRLARWPFYKRMILFVFDCLACCLLDRTVFVGEHDWRLFKRIIPFRKLCLIRNGVHIRGEPRAPKEDGMIYLGRISPEKNIVGLIKAAETAKVKLDLYGSFDRRDTKFSEIVRQIIQNSHYVQWKGPVAFNAVPETLSRYPVFINASFSEGLPTSVLEATAKGLYLVLSDIPQHRLLRMPDCMYVSPHQIDLTGIPRDHERLGLANREYVEQEFSASKMIEGYFKLYKDLS